MENNSLVEYLQEYGVKCVCINSGNLDKSLDVAPAKVEEGIFTNAFVYNGHNACTVYSGPRYIVKFHEVRSPSFVYEHDDPDKKYQCSEQALTKYICSHLHKTFGEFEDYVGSKYPGSRLKRKLYILGVPSYSNTQISDVLSSASYELACSLVLIAQ